MALRQLDQPFPTFTDLDGSPLDAGYVYFGVENDNPETAPITVYYDAALTQAAAQPLRTSNGYVVRNGAPAVLYADVAYSLTVRNKTQALVFYSQSGDGLSPGGALVAANNLSDVASASASLVNLGLTATAAELNQINDKAPLASPALTGTPTAPTAAGGTNTTQLATAAFVQQETPELTQLEVENPASTVFGQVSGERLSQAGVVSFTAQEQQIGVGQTWQLVTRSVNVWYQNTTGKPIGVFGRGSISSPVVWDVGPSTTDFIVIDMSDGDSGDSADYGWIIVPVDHYYRNTATWNSARELR